MFQNASASATVNLRTSIGCLLSQPDQIEWVHRDEPPMLAALSPLISDADNPPPCGVKRRPHYTIITRCCMHTEPSQSPFCLFLTAMFHTYPSLTSPLFSLPFPR